MEPGRIPLTEPFDRWTEYVFDLLILFDIFLRMKIIMDNKNKLFWILQVSGWLLFAIAMQFYNVNYIFESLEKFYLVFITYVLGFTLTSGLRYFYRYIYKKTKSIGVIPVYILISITILHIFWEPLDVLVSSPFWTQERIDEWLKIYTQFSFVKYYKTNLFWYLILLLWSVLYFAIKFMLEWQYQKDRAEKAQVLAQQAQLQMLRYQLNPHFLFNSLNSIRAMIDEDVKAAKGMITELSEFLRYSLLFDNDAEKPLKRELEAIRNYFSIEKKRFEEKLNVEFDITPEAEKFPVLSFLLQPFVENAVKYGMQTSAMPLTIRISGEVRKNRLMIDIFNSGRWVELPDYNALSADVQRTGKGLENVRQRLEKAYPDKHLLDIQKTESSVNVHLEITNP